MMNLSHECYSTDFLSIFEEIFCSLLRANLGKLVEKVSKKLTKKGKKAVNLINGIGS